jgi:uncharacterized protein (TIGR03437 family)
MNRAVKLFFALFALVPGDALAQQTSIIPITSTTNSNGAYVRGASNDGKRIVFESPNDYTGENKDGNNEIFVYDTDLRKIIQVTKTGTQSSSANSGSIGGQTLSGRNCPGGCPPGQATALNGVPAISGDGTRIVFASTSGQLTEVSNADGNAELYLALLPRGATAATVQRITETDGLKDSFDNNTPSINFDGSVITFVSTRSLFKLRGVLQFSAQNEDKNAQIYLYEVNTRKYTQVTHKRIDEGIKDFEAKGFISNPTLSGDGKTLAFLSGYNFSGTAAINNTDLNGEIYLYKAGDPVNQVTQVTNTIEQAEVPEDGAVNVLSRFSKHLSDDGSLLVFESAGGTAPTKTGERIRDVFLYNANTKAFTQITTQDVGQRDLSDFNYFPSINGEGTLVAFSSKLNLPVVNDTAGNFNNSREIFRYDIAASTPSNPKFILVTQTEVSPVTTDQRLILFAPFISDSGQSIAFSNNGNLLASQFNSTAEVFQAVLRPAVRENSTAPVLANAASFDQTAVARGSIVAAFGPELSNSPGESQDVENYPYELNGVSVTVGDSLSGIAGRLISVSSGQVNFVLPTGLAADDDVLVIINNNGIISRTTADIRDAAPGVYAVRSDGKGQANAKCMRTSDSGKETEYASLPCPLGYQGAANSLVLYGTGWRFGADIRVRFRFKINDVEEDEVEVIPSYSGAYVDDGGKEHLGLDQIIVSLDEDLANRVNVQTMVLLTSNFESVTSQEEVTTEFAGFEQDLSVINGASQESGPIARGSIAYALVQNDDDETDVFSEQTIEASRTNPPFELGGVKVKVAGVAARILRVAPEEVRFIVPANIDANDSALVQVMAGGKTFNARQPVKDAAPGVFTETEDGDGKVTARCGLILANGAIEYTAPPCAVSKEGEKRILILTGTGWRFASGVKAIFDGIDLIPSYAGSEPGLPGVDRIEIPLTSDLAEDIAGKEKNIVIQVTINSETVSSQTGATVEFQESVAEEELAGERTRQLKSVRGRNSTAKRNPR